MSAYKKKTYDTLIVLDYKLNDELNGIIKDNNVNTINVSSMIDNDKTNDDYIVQM